LENIHHQGNQLNNINNLAKDTNVTGIEICKELKEQRGKLQRANNIAKGTE